MIETLKTIFFISIIVWLFPPIRQFKTKYFWFFLILALADPITHFLRQFSIYNPSYYFYVFISFLLIVSLQDKNFIIKAKFFWLTIFILSIIGFFLDISNNSQLLLLLFTNSVILFILLRNYIVEFVTKKNNLFLLFLVIYQLTIISKFLNLLLGFADATAFFIITSIFQIAFGLFFSIFREDNPKLVL